MYLVDTSIWVDHFRHGDTRLAQLLEHNEVLMHPLIVGELALGSLRRREAILADLQLLPAASVATHDEVLYFVTRNGLFARGIGIVDAHLLASAQLTPGTSLWTRDRRLGDVATALGLAANFLT